MKRFLTQLLVGVGIFSIYLVVSIVLFFPRWSHLTTHFGTPDFDTDSTIWYQWAKTFTDREDINFAYTNELVAFPFGYDVTYIPYFSLVYEANMAVMNALGGGWQAIMLAVNVSTLLTYPLGSIAAFALTYYLTRKLYPSFISGLIFGFSYYHVMMMGGSLSLNHIELIPIFYLFFLYFLDKPNWKSFLLSSLSFILLFMSNAYWAFFSMVFTPIFFCFYSKHLIKKRLQLAIIYYPCVLTLTIIANLDYIWSQLYNLSPYYLLYVFPKSGTVKDQLLNTASFFAPSLSAVARPWYYSKGEHFLGYSALLISFIAFFSQRKHRNYGIFLGCLLLAILLSSKVSPFLAINEIYFQYFRAFRAVSRLVIFASLFLGVVTAYSLERIIPYLQTRWPFLVRTKVLYILGIILPCLIILEGFTLSNLNRRMTSFERLAKLYEPLKTNDDVKRIVSYPFVIAGEGDGFPQNFELIGQVVHQKTLAGGISRTNPQARGLHEQIKSLSDPRTLDALSKNNIDTIVIYSYMYGNADDDTKKLMADERVNYLGTFEQPKDEDTYVSANDLSRKISVFQIKEVVERNRSLTATESAEVQVLGRSGQFDVQKTSATEYHLSLKAVSSPIDIVLHEPYSTKWQLYPPQSKTFGDFSYFFSSPIFVSEHQLFKESENIWQINPQTSINNLPPQSYRLNADGSVDMDLVLYFVPTLLQKVSDGIRISFFIVSIGLLVVSFIRTKFIKRHAKQ